MRSDDRDETARVIGEVILLLAEGAVKLFMLAAAIMGSLYVLLFWFGLSPLHAVWVLLGAPLTIVLLVSVVLPRLRSRDDG